MPIYAYHCPACDIHFDATRSVDERDSVSCGTCGSHADRPVSAPSFSLKGTGWAKDGYNRPASGADLKSGKLSPKDLRDIPVVGRDGKLRDKSGAVIAG